MTGLTLPEFTGGRPAAQVDASLRLALGACDRARECAVLWFAEVQRRSLYRTLGHASLRLYAARALGFSENRYRQFKRLADDLDRLPALRDAVARGDVGWTKAQQVARVATASTQAAWVAKATTSSRRDLQSEVRAARRRPSAAQPELAPADRGARVAAHDEAPGAADPPVTISLRADGLQFARFEALVERARKLRLVPAGAERLDLVLAGLEALITSAADPRAGAGPAPDEAASRGDPKPAPSRRPTGPAAQVIVHRCPDCSRAAAVTSRSERRLAPAQVDALACDAKVREPGRPNRATIPPATRAAVLARDRHRCAAPGCRATQFLEVHHVRPRRRGGSNRAENLVTLCSRCHAFAHEGGGRRLAPAQVAAGTGGGGEDRGPG